MSSLKRFQVEIIVPGAVIPTVVETPLNATEIRASLTSDGFTIGSVTELGERSDV